MKLSPSDFAFLYQECKRCFYLKVRHGFQRPRTSMPGIFSVIDSKMKDRFMNSRTESATPDLPPGEFAMSGKWVQSAPIEFDGLEETCHIRGAFDTVIHFDDGTYGVIDFKTSAVKPSSKFIYARQLHAYAYALEHAAPGKLNLAPVSRLGLLVYEPTGFDHDGGGAATLSGKITWVEIRRDDTAFLKFIREVMAVVVRPEPPPPSDKCLFCQYRDSSRACDW
ncbi:MAG: hypothetical protein Kow0074_13540 [Candidatus Zixiibacteriota bacterium]